MEVLSNGGTVKYVTAESHQLPREVVYMMWICTTIITWWLPDENSKYHINYLSKWLPNGSLMRHNWQSINYVSIIRYRKLVINISGSNSIPRYILNFEKKVSHISIEKENNLKKKTLVFKHLVRLQNQRIGQSRSINRIKAVPLTPWWWHGPRKKLPYTRLLHSGSKS